MSAEALTLDVVSEHTREGDVLYRAEVRRSDGVTVAWSKLTPNPVAALRDGIELLDKTRSDELFREAHQQAFAMYA